MSYEAVIGLEVHVELGTETKLFCSCKNGFGGEPNSRVCPICTGQPGTLPNTNKKAVFLALRAAKGLGCKINKSSGQCRKHYFYPDLPKGYQISQKDTPLGVSGEFEFPSDEGIKKIRIERIHIEEDAGKLIHREDGKTLVDYNRAGVPLIEIVTEPDIRSAGEARAFLEALRHTLIRAGISECRMERGAMRCDVNVSLRKAGESGLRDRVEMKNINTFSGAERAIAFEVARQTEILDSGGVVTPETRRWDDEKKTSSLMRAKESAIDYKFMPEPDIATYKISDADIEIAGKNLPETDAEKTTRFKGLGLGRDDIKRLLCNIPVCEFFEECERIGTDAILSAKLLVGDVTAYLTREDKALSETQLSTAAFSYIVSCLREKKITNISAKKLLEKLMKSGGDVKKLAESYLSVTDEKAITETVSEVLLENPKAVEDYIKGKEESFTFLMGQCMRKLFGRADVLMLQKILSEKINKEKENGD